MLRAHGRVAVWLATALLIPCASFGQAAVIQASESSDLFGAFADSMKLAAMEHALRVGFQAKTREALAGPFWSDYRRSVRLPGQWHDEDRWPVNYVGHPIHGAGAALIWLDHHPADRSAAFFTPAYFRSRGRAAVFSAVYSMQFEVGLLSEAAIGNVGLRPENAGWVDYVMTPAGAYALLLGEDALDRYFVRWLESKVKNRAVRATVRLVCAPSRFLANSAQHRLPWYRPDRALSWK